MKLCWQQIIGCPKSEWGWTWQGSAGTFEPWGCSVSVGWEQHRHTCKNSSNRITWMHLICQTLSQYKIFSRGNWIAEWNCTEWVSLWLRTFSSWTYPLTVELLMLSSLMWEPHGREGNSDKCIYTHVLHMVLIKSAEIHCFISLFPPLDLAGLRSHWIDFKNKII